VSQPWIHFLSRTHSISEPVALSSVHSSFSVSSASFLTKCKQKCLWEILISEDDNKTQIIQEGLIMQVKKQLLYASESKLFYWIAVFHSVSLFNILCVCVRACVRACVYMHALACICFFWLSTVNGWFDCVVRFTHEVFSSAGSWCRLEPIHLPCLLMSLLSSFP
jgi:hypothetical protein